MGSVLGGALFAAVFAWWWVNKPTWSGNDTVTDARPRPTSTTVDVPPALIATTPSTGFRPDIEGLRALAVLMVLGYHARFGILAGGFIGVDVFFVLSGFLISSLLLREMATTGTVSLANFWARRARRLLPASGLVLIATLIAGRWVLDGLSQMELARDSVASATFVANIRFWHVGTDYLSQGLPESPLLHFWSLAVEEQFYMIWPWLLLVLVRFLRLSRRALIVTLAVAAVASLIACIQLTGGASQPWAFFMLPARAWELLAGALLALAGDWLRRISPSTRSIVAWLGLIGAVIAGVAFRTTMAFPGWIAAIPVVATVAVVGTHVGGPVRGAHRALANPVLQWIGARSYAIYLWHFPILILAGRRWGDHGLVEGLPVATRLALLAASIGVAAVSYHLVENPVRHARGLSALPARSLAMGVWIVLISVGASLLVLNNPPTLATDEVAAEATVITVPPSDSASFPAETPVPSVAPSVASPVDSAATTSSPDTTTTTAPRAPVADASRDNPPSVASLIEANQDQLTAAVGVQKVPSNLSPSLSAARNDLPSVYDNGCILDVGSNQPKQCVYGATNSSTTVVLFGDSHAAQWTDALSTVASKHGWRLIVHVKKACPTATIPTDKDPNGTDCAAWRRDVLADIERLDPALVVISAYRYKQVGAAAGRDPDTVWREGIDKTVTALRPLTQRLLLLGDSPTPLEDVPSCLAGSLSNVGRCMNSRSGAVRPSRLGVERTVAAAHDATFIPTSDWACTASACPVIIGNVLMYRDNSHFSASATRLLTPFLDAAVSAAMP